MPGRKPLLSRRFTPDRPLNESRPSRSEPDPRRPDRRDVRVDGCWAHLDLWRHAGNQHCPRRHDRDGRLSLADPIPSSGNRSVAVHALADSGLLRPRCARPMGHRQPAGRAGYHADRVDDLWVRHHPRRSPGSDLDLVVPGHQDRLLASKLPGIHAVRSGGPSDRRWRFAVPAGRALCAADLHHAGPGDPSHDPKPDQCSAGRCQRPTRDHDQFCDRNRRRRRHRSLARHALHLLSGHPLAMDRQTPRHRGAWGPGQPARRVRGRDAARYRRAGDQRDARSQLGAHDLLRLSLRGPRRPTSRTLRRGGTPEPVKIERRLRRGWPWAALALFLVVPLALPEGFYLDLPMFTFMYAAMSVGWDVMGGCAGYVSLGHVGFFGLGSYAAALLLVHLGLPVFVTAPLVGVMASILGAGRSEEHTSELQSLTN